MNDLESAAVAEPIEKTVRRRKERDSRKPKRQPRYNVVLWNDDDHTYEYVIAMLMELFGYPVEKGYQLAKEVDTQGRVVLLTTTREHAELKRDQIHAYGRDDLIANCKGSMWSTVEPVESE
jgi:ATP-dependent Clp protease adaptor protein ClpS